MLPYPGASYKVLAKRSCILAKKIQKEELCDYFESVAKKATSKINNLPSTEGIAYHVALKISEKSGNFFL